VRIGGYKGVNCVYMLNIKDIISSKITKTVEKSQRAELIKELYSLYCSPVQNKLRKIENWKRYVKYCKENKLNLKENVDKFRKNKLFIKILPIKAFCFKTSHIKTQDLWYVLSVARDKNGREQSIAQFLL